MGILGRLSTLIKSNLNDAIDSMQDPAKELDQMIRDMEDSARQARTEVAQTMATAKQQQKRVDSLAADAKTWEEHAMRAVQAGDDALAKEALRRKAEKEAERLEAEKALQEQQVYVDQLTQGLKALEARVKDVKLRQGTLREKARANKKGLPPASRPRPSTSSSACRGRSRPSKQRPASATNWPAGPPSRWPPTASCASCRSRARSTTPWPS
jgi:phage shock protein A